MFVKIALTNYMLMKKKLENESNPKPWVFSLTSIYKVLVSLHKLVSS
jgi:hypothetical protein